MLIQTGVILAGALGLLSATSVAPVAPAYNEFTIQCWVAVKTGPSSWDKYISEPFLNTDTKRALFIQEFKQYGTGPYNPDCEQVIRVVGTTELAGDGAVITIRRATELKPNWMGALAGKAAPTPKIDGVLIVAPSGGSSKAPAPKRVAPSKPTKPVTAPAKPPVKKWTPCGRKGQRSCRGSKQ